MAGAPTVPLIAEEKPRQGWSARLTWLVR
jgi:hypothetical protein